MSQQNFDPNHDPQQQNPQTPQGSQPNPQQNQGHDPNQQGQYYGQQPYTPGYGSNQQGQGGTQGYPQPGYGQPIYVVQQPADINNMAMFAHLSPLLTLIATIVLWAVYKDKPGYERVRTAAARAFNLSATLVIVILGAFALLAVLMLLSVLVGAQTQSSGFFMVVFALFPVVWLLMLSAVILSVVFHIIGAVKANAGEDYKYPFPTIPILH